MKFNKKITARRISGLLTLSGKKQLDLAEHLDISPTTVSSLCNGRLAPNLEKLIKIADFFNVSTDYLLGRTDISTTDTRLADICKHTRLEESTIENLQELPIETKKLNQELKTFLGFVERLREESKNVDR